MIATLHRIVGGRQQQGEEADHADEIEQPPPDVGQPVTEGETTRRQVAADIDHHRHRHDRHHHQAEQGLGRLPLALARHDPLDAGNRVQAFELWLQSLGRDEETDLADAGREGEHGRADEDRHGQDPTAIHPIRQATQRKVIPSIPIILNPAHCQHQH